MGLKHLAGAGKLGWVGFRRSLVVLQAEIG